MTMQSKSNKAAWRRNKFEKGQSHQDEEAELFFRRIYSMKFDQFRSDILEMCEKMNIDSENLKPRTLEEFQEQVDYMGQS